MKKFLVSKETFVLWVFLLWRVGTLLLSFIAQNLLPFKKSFPYADTILVPSDLPQWLWQWGNFDGVHYLTLAKSGYDGFGTQVFFPLYPMLSNVLTNVTQNTFISAFLISNTAILFAGILLFKLVRKRFDETAAKWSVLFLFAFPSSLFFGAIYTESLFLLLTLAAFSFRGMKSFVAGILAGFTRLVGLFTGPFSFIGLLLYTSYLWWRFGRPLFFLSAQSAFGSRATSFTSLVTPFQVIYRYLKIFITVSVSTYDFWVAFSEISAFMLGIIILTWLSVKRKLPISWLLFSWVALILPSVSGTFSSMPRYLITIFPIYIGLALIKNKYLKLAILTISVILLMMVTILFTRGYWVS